MTSQVTAVLVVLVTLAVNCCVPNTSMDAELGFTVTAGGAGMMVTVALADFVVSACEVAVTVTCGGFGTVAGAA